MFLIILLAIFLILLIWFKFGGKRKPPNFPPGPNPLPLIGTIHITQDAIHLACMKLTKIYGPIVGMKFASEWSVVLHGAKLIREAFAESSISGRAETEANCFIMGDFDGIIQASGDIWKEQRRFALKTLRDFGFGKKSMEEMLLEEGNELIEWIKKQDGNPIELDRRFKLAVVNSLWRIVTGKRYNHDDVEILEILDKIEHTEVKLLESPIKAAFYFFYPSLAKFFPNVSGWKNLQEAVKQKHDMFDKIINEHQQVEVGTPRDFIDVYLAEIRQTTDSNSSFYAKNAVHSLRSVISDFFMAGADTASVTLDWLIIYLLHNPGIQKKMQEELDFVLAGSKELKLSDRKSLPFVECVVMEVLRCSSIAPIGVGHMCTEDVKLGGYDIPKGTVIFPNQYAVHHDPEVWGDPAVFRPERFLNPDGTCMRNHESLIPFSVGRRTCMGKDLARDTLFLFTALLSYNFNIEVTAGTPLPTLEPRLGKIFLEPAKFCVKMKFRHEN